MLNKSVRVLSDKDFEDIDFIEENVMELFLYEDYLWSTVKVIPFHIEDLEEDE